MTEHERQTQVLNVVGSFVDRLLVDFDVVDLLTELTESCAELLDVAAAGFLLADAFGKLSLLAATTEQARDLDCYATGEPISVADVHFAAARWPVFVPAAVNAGFSALHAVPMRAAGDVLGTFGLFGVRPGALADGDRLIAQTLAHIACVAILQEQAPTPATIIPQLRNAFSSRIVVEQAKGFREILDVSIDEAFKVLRGYSRAHGEHLTDVARRLMTDRYTRPVLVAAITEFAAGSQR
ncbi:GAF and ANTAR domain-containing protein [Mycolicibacterium sp. PAM1]|uniref:GAF and ANTAR domain-containing protein n=1 Tax=Mycolicibacterium sp. PAM1 TaxID=2853535 RepID=UPI001C3E016C|nr:GAF and ANTAR domain-containing protein [Mycolicibacterium sp. PAM1]MBV5246100.1 GAF and ANTAR domain-containing protein [Mycolicibacterium sp. PAM1]